MRKVYIFGRFAFWLIVVMLALDFALYSYLPPFGRVYKGELCYTTDVLVPLIRCVDLPAKDTIEYLLNLPRGLTSYYYAYFGFMVPPFLQEALLPYPNLLFGSYYLSAGLVVVLWLSAIAYLLRRVYRFFMESHLTKKTSE